MFSVSRWSIDIAGAMAVPDVVATIGVTFPPGERQIPSLVLLEQVAPIGGIVDALNSSFTRSDRRLCECALYGSVTAT